VLSVEALIFAIFVTISSFIPVWLSIPDPAGRVLVVALSCFAYPGAFINLLVPGGSFLANVDFWFLVGFLFLKHRAFSTSERSSHL